MINKFLIFQLSALGYWQEIYRSDKTGKDGYDESVDYFKNISKARRDNNKIIIVEVLVENIYE